MAGAAQRLRRETSRHSNLEGIVALSLSEIRAAIEAGDLRLLIGEVEGEHLDAKSQPYIFGDGNDIRREFAKDVASFANAAGGCIIIGAETAVSQVQAGEQIIALKPFPEALFVTDQQSKVIAEWVYPRPAGISIKFFPDHIDQTRGLGVVFVPAQESTAKPFLVTRSLGDKKTTEFLIGYAERHLDRTEIKGVAELHHGLRTGMNLESTLIDRMAALEKLSAASG